MRELKFRAWDGERMHYFDISDTIAPSLEDNIMQFTALTDKNGKEIWEGDLFTVSNNVTYTVRYCKGEEHDYEWIGGCFVLSSQQATFPFDEYAIAHGEVIGNIHETPDLL